MHIMQGFMNVYFIIYIQEYNKNNVLILFVASSDSIGIEIEGT